MQRVLTRSDYDHIALVIRYENDKIVVFESLRDTGVTMCPWEKFMNLKWYSNYDRVIYRRLNFPRTKEFNQVLEDFVK